MAATWWTDPADLDEEQTKVVSLPPDGHFLVLGPPGSGKTNLLLLRASYLHKAGIKHIVVLAFGRVLKEFIAAGSAHYPFDAEKIQTYVRWGKTLLNENGISVPDANFDEVRSHLQSQLSLLGDKGAPGNMFDCILLDEAQDYSPAEIEVIRKFAHRLFVVGDRNQRILNEDGDALEQLENDGLEVRVLTAHYRNGLAICRVADGILDLIDDVSGLEATSNYDEETFPSTVKWDTGLSLEDQVDAVVKQIETQLDAYPEELIGVLCPRKEELSIVADLLAVSDIAMDVHVQHGEYSEIDSSRRVILTTIHGAKGLEFRALHLLSMEFVKRFRNQKRMCYTAVTRCKTSLAIYSNGDLPGYLERGLQACGDPPKAPLLKDLFE